MNISINLELWMQYLDMLRTATMSINYNDNSETCLCFTSGKYSEYGGTNVFLDFSDIEKILRINDILGVNGLLAKEVDKEKDGRLMRVDYEKHAKIKADLVYGTLSKYVTQMLMAGMGKNLFPEIKCLEKHKTYFWIKEEVGE